MTQPTDGQILSAMERNVSLYRNRLKSIYGGSGMKLDHARIEGFRAGWEAAVGFLKMSNPPPEKLP